MLDARSHRTTLRGLNASVGEPWTTVKRAKLAGMTDSEFEQVLAEPDPLARARRATELLSVYAERSTELARLRREAIEDAAGALKISYAAVATQVGLSKARITQIRQKAPARERAFFGIGRVDIAIPVRTSPDRPLGVVAAEDSTSAEHLSEVLATLQLTARTVQIPTDATWAPAPASVAICGPKSSAVIADLIAADPLLSFAPNTAGRWVITNRITGEIYSSPLDDGGTGADLAYVARLPLASSWVLVIAGVHALGSLGAVEHLRTHIANLYQELGTGPFSMVVRSTFSGTDVTTTEATWGPAMHT
jgi:hypothetical protein